MKRHIRVTSISAEEYLRKEMTKANRPQTDNELIGHVALLNQQEHLNSMGMDEKMSHKIQCNNHDMQILISQEK